MVIHYFLFKHGTWYNRRVGERCNIFDFCDPFREKPSVCVFVSNSCDAHGPALWRCARLESVALAIWQRHATMAAEVSSRVNHRLGSRLLHFVAEIVSRV